MTHDPAALASVGLVVISASVAIGAYWARLENPVRRSLVVAGIWLAASAMLFQFSVLQVAWAGTYSSRILGAHVLASAIPGAVAFSIARRASQQASRLTIVGRVALVALVIVVVSVPAALLTGCLLDPRCY